MVDLPKSFATPWTMQDSGFCTPVVHQGTGHHSWPIGERTTTPYEPWYPDKAEHMISNRGYNTFINIVLMVVPYMHTKHPVQIHTVYLK